jgi:hypothetical protein
MNPTPKKLRDRARRETEKAQRLGLIRNKPKRCERCDTLTPLIAHHPDYGQPLLVEFLCGGCHKQVHILAGEVKDKKGGVLRLKTAPFQKRTDVRRVI